jgi:hypothetical protein
LNQKFGIDKNFVIAGFLSITGIIPIITEEGGRYNSHNEMNNMLMEDSSQDRDEMNISYNNTNMDMGI